MKNVTVLVLALGMAACNSSPRLVDSGGIVLADTGTAMGHDTGTAMGHDAGSSGATCGSVTASATNPFPALPTGCVPRCMGATVAGYNACVTTYQMIATPTAADRMTLTTCINTALRADHTAMVSVDIGGGNTVPISCGGDDANTFSCLTWQGLAAESASCGTELGAYVACANGLAAGADPMTGCPTEYNARATCRMTNMAAIQTSLNSLGQMCFAQ